MTIFDWTQETPLDEVVFQALGAASMCWEFPEKAGVFNSDRAKEIGDEVMAYFKEKDGPLSDG